MKKLIHYFCLALFSVLLMGCSDKMEKEKQANYDVVEISSDMKVDELFDFKSVSKIALDGKLSSTDVESGCYCIGSLENGKSVIWRSDDDGYGYDDCLFVYVEDVVTDMQIMTYAAALKETPISYDSYKEKYE